MTTVEVKSFVRVGDQFLAINEVPGFAGDCTYVPGAISLMVDSVELFGLDLWDDVNWLWPFLVQTLDECRQTGSGKRYFPDQPIAITAKRVRPGYTLIKVADVDSISRAAVARDDDLFRGVARAGLEFFTELGRLCPGWEVCAERTTLEVWDANRS